MYATPTELAKYDAIFTKMCGVKRVKEDIGKSTRVCISTSGNNHCTIIYGESTGVCKQLSLKPEY